MRCSGCASAPAPLPPTPGLNCCAQVRKPSLARCSFILAKRIITRRLPETAVKQLVKRSIGSTNSFCSIILPKTGTTKVTVPRSVFTIARTRHCTAGELVLSLVAGSLALDLVATPAMGSAATSPIRASYTMDHACAALLGVAPAECTPWLPAVHTNTINMTTLFASDRLCGVVVITVYSHLSSLLRLILDSWHWDVLGSGFRLRTGFRF